VAMGAVDSFRERDELERFARRFLIPYVDVGMDVVALRDGGFLISGQVILSLRDSPCLHCCHFITDERLQREAERYGAAGGRPQVVWPNGVLASTAVGFAVELLTPWDRSPSRFIYMSTTEADGRCHEPLDERASRHRLCAPPGVGKRRGQVDVRALRVVPAAQ
jgi:molybdopterin-synthase adenylyltransferase